MEKYEISRNNRYTKQFIGGTIEGRFTLVFSLQLLRFKTQRLIIKLSANQRALTQSRGAPN